MLQRYTKTEAGRAEIRARTRALSRPARNLLLIIDDSRSGDEWVALVHGASAAELAQLVDAGLVAPLAAPARKGPALEQVLQGLGYRTLYDRLTAEARPRLGLVKGYRMVLEIERCGGAEEIRALALRFIDEVRAEQGEAAAREFCRSLGFAP